MIYLPSPVALDRPIPPVIDGEALRREHEERARRLEELGRTPDAAPPPDAPPPPPPPVRASRPGAGPSTPLPWPPLASLPEAYTPEGFRARLEHALSDPECAMGRLELVSIDCDEFPCMALTVAHDAQARASNLNACPVWNVHFRGTQYLEQARGGVHYRTWVPLAPHDADARLVMTRSTARTRRVVAQHAARQATRE